MSDQSESAAGRIDVTLPDGRVVAADVGTTIFDLARREGLPATGKAIAARLDGVPTDLHRKLTAPAHISLIGPTDPEALEIYRHTTSHVMAQAVKELFPGAKIAQGPAIDDGFYYDFRHTPPFTDDDLPRIEARMREIVARNLRIVRHEVGKDDAVALFEGEDEPFKLHFVREKSGPVASYYEQGAFRDFCRGPHLPATGRLGAFKLTALAGAYWLGSERNEMLWRIYGTAFATQAELDAHLARIEEAKKRDHRRLVKELDLVSIQDEAGAGLVFWHPKGTIVRRQIEEYVRMELDKRHYVFVTTPHIAKDTLFRTSGHYDYYRDNMFRITTPEDEEFFCKPMNCPGHVMIYGTGIKSYRDLPVRMAEFGTVYRFERSGTMHGLFRVRGFTQDDAHIFCTPEQIGDEIAGVIELFKAVFDTFGFTDLRYELSVWDPAHPENYVGDPADWEAAEKTLVDALARFELKYTRYVGEAAFYGPKIDVKVVDALGRPWQLGTVQFDFNLPKRFKISYVDHDGHHKTPHMVHRALVGSLERFFGILVEHYGGAFPVWLAPVQARVLPVSDKVADYAGQLHQRLVAAGLRAEIDRSPDKIGAKIRDAELSKIPYMLIVGAREAENGAVSLRIQKAGDQGSMPVDAFLERALSAVRTRALEP